VLCEADYKNAHICDGMTSMPNQGLDKLTKPMRVLMAATSYPRSPHDWQGLFIKKIADALADDGRVKLSLWAPKGPLHTSITYSGSATDEKFLERLAAQGGIAHLLRAKPLRGGLAGAELVYRLRRAFLRQQPTTDLFHINWAQNALPIWRLGVPTVVTILGTDMQLLRLPGMIGALRAVLKSTRSILAPNANWMAGPLQQKFGDLVEVIPTPFGIDPIWYQINRKPSLDTHDWIVVLRITKQKIGPLFEWGEQVFQGRHRLHLFGPNQENVHIPSWVHYHGPATAAELANQWFPTAAGLITLSQHSEGRPQIILEAMAAGLPIIASAISAHSDIVNAASHGALIATKAEFLSAIERISDPKEQACISRNCREFCQQNFGTWQDCSDRFINLYGRLVQ